MAEPKTTLLEQDAAIYDYLDALLREIPEEAPRGAVSDRKSSSVGAVSDRDPARERRTKAPEHRREIAPPTAEATPAAESKPVGAAPPPRIPEPASAPARAPGEPPEWAHPSFQALLFQVGRLSLAVPLITLEGVVPWDGDHVSTMPRQPAWVHGLMRHRDRNVTVIDTERLVLPAERRPAAEAQTGPGHILLVGDGRWGLACRTVGEVIRLRPDEVKWRGAGGQRPWLAGTVLGRLCALMDTGAFADMLQQGTAAGAAATADRRTGHG
ncbi:chemotaxis protein CheW [Spiribacter halobius]|uniref:CheW-like domain-containing protein n=1 Tax=Sediminicurvatus halobius TaxID=2182432 RepID=A0A2U2N3Q6_9GAMM|nr:chemotaxis protein CheW [Spiribacter halobius]PWG63668.1 hypothetical protein DEM34_07255 [Spiribacter halobius]UEX79807.1 chemotaxis protein CheW [Spiribacter halobius]